MNELIAAHNNIRFSKNLGALAHDPKLSQQAQAHAETLSRNIFLRWFNPHMGYTTRLKKAGYTTGAENFTYGQPTVEAVMKAWVDSPGHRANILGPYNRIGVGFAKGNWIVLFGATP